VLIAGAVLATFVTRIPATAAASDGVEQQIREAYARVLDRSLPMHERVAVLEEGEELRATLREFDALGKISGIELRSVQLAVRSVRPHHGDAEVALTVFADLYMVTGWNGVARKIDGEWVVARATVCTLLMEWTPVRCPGGPQSPKWKPRSIEPVTRDGAAALPLTFADGDRAELIVPGDLDGRWQIRPHANLLLNGRTPIPVYFSEGHAPATQPVRRYAAGAGPGVVLDAMNGLMVRVGGWTALVPTENLSERQRALVAAHLSGYTTKSGFPVLLPTGPVRFRKSKVEVPTGVRLAKSALNVDESANPMELSYSDGDDLFVMIVVTPGPCPTELQSPVISGTYHAEERCTDNQFGRIAVEGNSDIVDRLLDEARVVNYRQAQSVTAA
jgi:hypothetical protein